MEQSPEAIKMEGVISIIGFLGGVGEKGPSFLDCLNHVCTVRGVYVGSRVQFEDMVSQSHLNGSVGHLRLGGHIADYKTEPRH